MTWDGYDCWDGAEANSTSTKLCPTSIGMVHPEGLLNIIFLLYTNRNPVNSNSNL